MSAEYSFLTENDMEAETRPYFIVKWVNRDGTTEREHTRRGRRAAYLVRRAIRRKLKVTLQTQGGVLLDL